jgi:hypothetical protein
MTVFIATFRDAWGTPLGNDTVEVNTLAEALVCVAASMLTGDPGIAASVTIEVELPNHE